MKQRLAQIPRCPSRLERSSPPSISPRDDRGMLASADGPIRPVTAFEQLFAERGLPQAIRSDNGVPFARPNALFNLSKLSVWWLRLGIAIARIKPGHPQQNGGHERMHPEERGDPPARHEQPAAAGPLRRFRARIQQRTSAPGALGVTSPPKSAHPRQGPLRACPSSPIRCTTATSSLPPADAFACIAKGSTSRACWPVKGSGIKEVAGQLYDFRPRLLRSGAENFAANRQPLRPKVVTHVLGTFCYLCVRAGHAETESVKLPFSAVQGRLISLP